MNHEKIIGFVPARGGSKSIPLKNIKLFCGQPLIYWTLKALQDSKAIDLFYLATDSDEIEACAKGFNFSKLNIYRRDIVNAEDHSSTESVMLEFIQKENYVGDELFMLIQPTSPFVTHQDISQAIALYRNSGFDSMLSCSRTKRFFWNQNGTPVNYNFNDRPRRQDFEGILMENGAFYMNTVSNIIRDKNRLSGKIGIFEMQEFAGHELDEPHDWAIGEALMRHYMIRQHSNYQKKIKLVITDVDGVLTDAGMYYTENGDELKKFNTRDGMAFQLLREAGIKTAIITTEETNIVERRATKLKVDYLYQGKKDGGKLVAAMEICALEGLNLSEVAYIGDDINCYELLSNVGLAACPADAVNKIKSINGILCLEKHGGEGVVREFVDIILQND